MFLKIKFDNSSEKGKNFAQDGVNSDLEDPKAGIMSNGNCCTCLNACRPGNSSLLKCCMCDESYHPDCIKRPLHNDVVSTINENPNCWWTCLSCLLSVQPFTNVESTENRVSQRVNEVLGTFKDDILTAIEGKLSKLKENLNHGASSQGVKRKMVISDSHDDEGMMCKIPRTVETKDDNNEVVFVKTTESVNSKSTYASALSKLGSKNKVLDKPLSRAPRSSHSHNNFVSNSGNKKFLLHYRPIIDKKLILKTEEWYQMRKNISEKLVNVKVSFSHYNPKSGKVVLGFPNEHSKETATTVLKDMGELWCFEQYTPEKMLPKLTIHNVPLDFEMPQNNDNANDNPNVSAERDLVKNHIWKTIVDKNDGVRSLIENGSSLEIVYFRKHKFTATVAVKVSPDIRLYILEKCDAKLYLFSGCCRISDRCHYQQCFHCLKFGHIYKDCPQANNSPTCMYCAEPHDSRTCSKIHLTDEHICANCKSSKSPSISKTFSHCARSKNCPTALSIVNKINNNTQFDISPASKNMLNQMAPL